MEVKDIVVKDEDKAAIEQIDYSITHWSVELVKIMLKADSLKANLGGLYQARNEKINSMIKESGLDLKNVDQFKFDENLKKLSVLVRPNEDKPS